MADVPIADARRALAEYGILDASIAPLDVGLINRTFHVERPDGKRFVLQRVNPIFTPRVHEDIEAVTAYVRRAQMGHAPVVLLPDLIRSKAGALYVEKDGAIWRLLSHIEGETRERLSSPAEAREAGSLLARFHGLVADLDHEFKNARLGVHDTKRHLDALRRALLEHRGKHPHHAIIAPIGEEVLALAERLPPLPGVRDRVVHGDPKISNLLFDPRTGRGIGIVDLDTLARMPLPLELGDAFRSWCNPNGEDRSAVEFSLDLFAAAIEGYAAASRGRLDPNEWRAIVDATTTIIVELSARFLADALNETYFGWDPSRFRTRGEHNELRARGQLSLAHSLMARSAEAHRIVRAAFEA